MDGARTKTDAGNDCTGTEAALDPATLRIDFNTLAIVVETLDDQLTVADELQRIGLLSAIEMVQDLQAEILQAEGHS